ncbi:hypothetical protein PRUB_a3733 [Pseudoalteromonas rubra]|uniref:Uncharacterized protein n=1 Tax=Pseudoalteromonas rubra TaxID=43658 RepID=A0A8T0C968_9GAMM|nr:hypothetical protein PRUB_a3733 [Pseudoalteromonas rubra]
MISLCGANEFNSSKKAEFASLNADWKTVLTNERVMHPGATRLTL